jgi:hypothetical protein
VKVSVNGDGTVLFFTPKGRMLVDAPGRPTSVNARSQRLWEASSGQRLSRDLPSVPSVHRGARSVGERALLSNGAALYRDSDVPWEIEAAAREALEDFPGS